MRHSSRAAFVVAGLAVMAAPIAALADRASDKRAFLAQCDESISIDRLAGAPHKFIGKKVDVHGVVGPAMETTDAFSLDSTTNESLFVVVVADARRLEQGQQVRVLGVVTKPISSANNMGGSGTYAVVQGRFIA